MQPYTWAPLLDTESTSRGSMVTFTADPNVSEWPVVLHAGHAFPWEHRPTCLLLPTGKVASLVPPGILFLFDQVGWAAEKEVSTNLQLFRRRNTIWAVKNLSRFFPDLLLIPPFSVPSNKCERIVPFWRVFLGTGWNKNYSLGNLLK